MTFRPVGPVAFSIQTESKSDGGKMSERVERSEQSMSESDSD
jgi:hypothetical protein